MKQISLSAFQCFLLVFVKKEFKELLRFRSIAGKKYRKELKDWQNESKILKETFPIEIL